MDEFSSVQKAVGGGKKQEGNSQSINSELSISPSRILLFPTYHLPPLFSSTFPY
jgi:hypothetical protein